MSGPKTRVTSQTDARSRPLQPRLPVAARLVGARLCPQDQPQQFGDWAKGWAAAGPADTAALRALRGGFTNDLGLHCPLARARDEVALLDEGLCPAMDTASHQAVRPRAEVGQHAPQFVRRQALIAACAADEQPALVGGELGVRGELI